MSTVKKAILAVLLLPFIFNGGYDILRDYKARKVAGLVAKTIVQMPNVGKVKVHSCTAFKHYEMWACDVEVTLKDGQSDRRILPVPYQATE